MLNLSKSIWLAFGVNTSVLYRPATEFRPSTPNREVVPHNVQVTIKVPRAAFFSLASSQPPLHNDTAAQPALCSHLLEY